MGQEGTFGGVRSEIGDGSCEGGADVERVEFDAQGASDSERVLDPTVAYREPGVFSKGQAVLSFLQYAAFSFFARLPDS